MFREIDGEAAFAAEPVRQPFREQIEFLRQKRPTPSRAWTDYMHGEHDRAFVVAGATDLSMVEDFHEAVIRAAETLDIKAFGKEFDAIVARYGWDYKGGRDWRIRTIFRVNLRTSYMAGWLQQMRDPDAVRMRPFWQYRHGETRVPQNPRPEHESWHGLVLRHDDPWWNTHFPPNGWYCSCGVRPLSRGDLRRLSFAYGDPARYALHQIVTATVTANGSGLTPLFEVVPNIRPGAATGLAVVLIRPFCKALILPQRSRPGLSRGLHTSGLAFDWGQTLL